MQFSDAKELAKKVKGSKIARDGDEFVVIGKNGGQVNEAGIELISSIELTISEEKSINKNPPKVPTKRRRVKGVGPDMKWKGEKVFKEPYTDMMDSGKLYKGAYGTGKKR